VTLFLALAFLREGRTQSGLIVAAVGIGVAVIVFISALVTGLQANLIDRTLGTQAHVVMTPPDERARPLVAPAAGEQLVRRTQRTAQRIRSIDGWQQVLAGVQGDPEVEAAVPVASGPGFATRGQAQTAVQLVGTDLEVYDRIVALRAALTVGDLPDAGGELLIGAELADDLGVAVGDKLRLEGVGGRSELCTVVGLFELGNREADERWVFTTLRGGQTLLDLVGGASSLALRVRRYDRAEAVAQRLQARTGLLADSWMARNAQLMQALRSQTISTLVIRTFVMLSVAIGIASVLVVSVMQRRRQVGILRAMGLPRAAVAGLFLVQGAVLGAFGALLGSSVGYVLARLFTRLVTSDGTTPLFRIEIGGDLVLLSAATAIATGVLAAALPALSAARLDPAVAIRQDT
jgi:lipoprotein-releasing system permease protein